MIYKVIKGYEDYLISDTGRVYSLKKQCYLKPQTVKNYLQVRLWSNNHYKNMYVHRLVAAAFVPNPSNCKSVDHINFNEILGGDRDE